MSFHFQHLKDPFFASRDVRFWACLAFCLGIVVCIDGMAMTAPEQFHNRFISSGASPSGLELLILRVRGAVAIFATLVTMSAFLRKSGATRFMVMFAMGYTLFFFVYDLAHAYLDTEILLIAQNPLVVAFLLARPVGIYCLFHISRDLERTRHLETVTTLQRD